jgi:hypothetical protein
MSDHGSDIETARVTVGADGAVELPDRIAALADAADIEFVADGEGEGR